MAGGSAGGEAWDGTCLYILGYSWPKGVIVGRKYGILYLEKKRGNESAGMRTDNRKKELILYHGSPNKEVVPVYGLGNDKHDYGRGFYLTECPTLAAEWSVCNPIEKNGWVHQFKLDTTDLKILDFEEHEILSWLAELMKHRDADTGRRYRVLAPKFIERYQISTEGYDVIRGWRANASYFYIAKSFVRDEVDLAILPQLLRLGDLGIQYCIKTEKAFRCLKENVDALKEISYGKVNPRYTERDRSARDAMYALINSDENKIEHVFSSLI